MFFFNYKFVLKKVSKSDIFFTDSLYNQLNLERFKSYHLKIDEINLFYFFETLKNYFFNENCKTLKLAYFFTIINKVEPKVIIDNNESTRGKLIRDLYPSSKLIMYQNGIDFKNNNNLKRSFNKTKPDHYLIWSKKFSNITKQKKKILITGSLRNNEKKLKKRKKIYDIMFISEFRIFDKLAKKKVYKINNKFTSKILRILNNYSLSYKKSICIGFSSNRVEKKNKISFRDEIKFFNKYLNNFNIDKISNEKLAEKSKLIICMTSSFGNELISKGHKVLFLNFNYKFFNLDFNSKEKNGPIWQKEFDQSMVIKKMNNLLKINNNKYQKLVKKYFKLNTFDENNTKFKRLIKKIIE